jgi:lysophospholipase L1-like esterase
MYRRQRRAVGLGAFAAAALALGLGLGLGLAGCVPTAPATARYVALGDSYTAGPNIPTQLSNAGIPAGCDQSDHNYPHLVAPRTGLLFSDASCIGATTGAMTVSQGVNGGNNPPQFDRLTADTTVVTLGVGGNDIGFIDIATTCGEGALNDPTGTPCQNAYVVNGDDFVSDRIVAMEPNLATAIDGIHSRAPQAKVFVVGYPAIVPDSGTGCFPSLPFTPGDVPYLRAKEKELDHAIATVAAAHTAIYVDTYTPSIGHDACAPAATRWVEPLVPSSPAAPLHPNGAGEQAIANIVAQAMKANGIPIS